MKQVGERSYNPDRTVVSLLQDSIEGHELTQRVQLCSKEFVEALGRTRWNKEENSRLKQ